MGFFYSLVRRQDEYPSQKLGIANCCCPGLLLCSQTYCGWSTRRKVLYTMGFHGIANLAPLCCFAVGSFSMAISHKARVRHFLSVGKLAPHSVCGCRWWLGADMFLHQRSMPLMSPNITVKFAPSALGRSADKPATRPIPPLVRELCIRPS